MSKIDHFSKEGRRNLFSNFVSILTLLIKHALLFYV